MSGVKGRSGRRPIPSDLKKLRGTYRSDQAAQDEINFPVLPSDRLTPPDWITEDEYALSEWNRIVPLLDSVKVLTDPDLLALANYCACASTAIRAQRAVNVEGMLIEVDGGTKVNPMIRVARDARTQCLRFGIEFGLTPAARSRIVGQKPAEEKRDPAEEFLFHPPKLVSSNE